MRALADSLLPDCFTLAVLWGPGKALGGPQSQHGPGDHGRVAWRWGRVCSERCVGGTGMGKLCGVLAGGLSFCWLGDGLEGEAASKE